MIGIKDTFDFVEGGRTFTCRAEGLRRGSAEQWWWFDVSGDRSRYAPFRVEDGETESSVRGRMVAYYDDLVARRGWVDRRGFGGPSQRV